MKRLILAVAPWLALVACGGSAMAPATETAASIESAPPPPVPKRPLASLLPATADVVVRIDAAALRASAAYARFGASLKDYFATSTEIGASPTIRESDVAYFAARVGGTDPWVLTVVRGEYDEDAVLAEMASPPTLEMRGLHRVFREAGGKSMQAFVGGHTYIAGTTSVVEAALAAQDSGEGHGVTDETLLALMAQVGMHERPIAAVVHFRPEHAFLFQRPDLITKAVEAVGFSIGFDEGADIAVVVHTPSPAQANAVVSFERAQIDEMTRAPEVQAPVFGALLRAIIFSTDGSNAWARLAIDADQLDAIVALFTSNPAP